MKVFMLKIFKDNLLILFICAVAFFIMVFYSPFIVFYWLFVFTLFYLFKGKFKNIFIIWSFFFFTWYCVFTSLLIGFDGKILIGGKYTGHLIHFLSPVYSKYFFLERFCLTTIIFFDLLSVKMGFPIYIPSAFKGLLVLVKFIFGRGGMS